MTDKKQISPISASTISNDGHPALARSAKPRQAGWTLIAVCRTGASRRALLHHGLPRRRCPLRFNLGEPARPFSREVRKSRTAESQPEWRFSAVNRGGQRTDRAPRIGFDFERALLDCALHRAGRRAFVSDDGHRHGEHCCAA